MRCAMTGLVLLGVLAGCGSSGGATPTGTPSVAATPSSSPAPTPTPTAVPTATPTPAPSGPYTLGVVAKGITLTMTPLDCASSQSAAPLGTAVLFIDCGGYVLIAAAKGGPLDPLAGTTATITWVKADGTTVTGTLDGTSTTLPRGDTGAYAGHGVAPGAFFVQLRAATEATELGGKVH